MAILHRFYCLFRVLKIMQLTWSVRVRGEEYPIHVPLARQAVSEKVKIPLIKSYFIHKYRYLSKLLTQKIVNNLPIHQLKHIGRNVRKHVFWVSDSEI